MQIETLAAKLHKARSTNASTNGFTPKSPTATKPSGEGIVQMSAEGLPGTSANALFIQPIGVGSDDATMSVRVTIWRLIGDDANTAMWIPATLCEVACTLGQVVGLAGKIVDETQRFADAITITTGTDGIGLEKISPANNSAASFSCDTKGALLAEIEFSTGGSATSCNALWARY